MVVILSVVVSVHKRKGMLFFFFCVALPNFLTKLKLRLQKKPHSSIYLLGISVSVYFVNISELLLFAGLGRVLT